MAKKLSRIFLLFLPLIFPFVALAETCKVTIKSVDPASPKLGEEFNLSVKVTGLEGYDYFLAKVDLGTDLGEGDYEWYGEKDTSKIIQIFDPASGGFKGCGYKREWAKYCAKIIMSGAIWEGKITAVVPNDFLVGPRVVRVRVRRGDTTPFYSSDPFPLTVAAGESPPPADQPPPEEPPQDTPPSCPFGIVLSEFMAYPESGQMEWVEIFNSNVSKVSLVGWMVDDVENGGETPKPLVDDGKNVVDLAAKAYYVYQTSSFFNNTGGDSVRLLCPDQKAVVDEHPYTTATKGLSWAKAEDSKWYETTTPTPNGKNVIAVPKSDQPKESNSEVDNEEASPPQAGTTAPEPSLGKVLGATEEDQGEITPEAASDYRPENPPKWRVGEVEAEATEATSPIGRMLEASASTMVNLSKGMMMSGGLVTLFSLILYVFKLKK